MEPRISRSRLALFVHVTRMQPRVPTHDAVWTPLAAIALQIQAESDPTGDFGPLGRMKGVSSLRALLLTCEMEC